MDKHVNYLVFIHYKIFIKCILYLGVLNPAKFLLKLLQLKPILSKIIQASY